ncbi:alpha-D-ribose 1-methylphosphonate 5-triphosphate diphosphatase [Tistlia consotensis]|uniref:Alpha-D-ribose 1-methylphosphonate 5-triphosphate diphosphatase n=1 Tax=Tistlia consotensis USBA 355 TaxID=560819 RepID=A0A1Y6CPU0_9PROT|nr:alpha-D-ribose 1-methylphosphonate 5-triphosphate diphosphatase [Tistlia consotensis]SMF80493.1 alpha-D-ribose 1-methylphosphonate 5-triphosphate diphosphatase [Tistlia consotensis USBA 355]SNR62809.1 alpha-D-ribose 1-methylphosphonate 5-triphosphate diphosphatase [Tistlia consotensis]
MTAEQLVLRNARIVLEDRIVEGTVSCRDGRIAELGEGDSALGEDLGGDWLLPGLIELHTDNLEGHLHPRPGVTWPTLPGLIAHDAELVAAGVTTVLDSLRIGEDPQYPNCRATVERVIEATAEARRLDTLRADHLLHLRCEVVAEGVVGDFEELVEQPDLRLVSLMDHTPGQRQFADMDAVRTYLSGRKGLKGAELEAYIQRRIAEAGDRGEHARAAISAIARERGLALASHDDATAGHVAEAAALGLTISEFPTSLEAGAAAREHGLKVVAGAPNAVRGGSSYGNVGALELAEAGHLEIFASDYVPASLLQALFLLAEVPGWDLPRAVATGSATPAAAVGLDDRGRIAPGLSADLIQVGMAGDLPVVRRVWRRGRRVI